MLKVFLPFLFVLFGNTLTAQSQGEMNEAAIKEFEKADKSLNAIYQQILKEYSSNSTFIKNLKISQRIWIQFRDAELNARYPDDADYGSVQPMCWYDYKTSLTIERTKSLKQWTAGIKEGDVCAGSVKTIDND